MEAEATYTRLYQRNVLASFKIGRLGFSIARRWYGLDEALWLPHDWLGMPGFRMAALWPIYLWWIDKPRAKAFAAQLKEEGRV